MAAFATAEDLATFLQRDLDAADTASAELALDLASGAIRAFTGQLIDFVANEAITVRLSPLSRYIFLPELPVTAVASVTRNAVTLATPQDYELDLSLGVIELRSWDRAPHVVTYSHGFATIPDEIKGVCLEAAAAMMNVPTQSGISSESIGSYRVSYDSARQAVVDLEAGRLSRYRDLVVA